MGAKGYHFTLLFTRSKRLFKDNGFNPLLGALISVIIFCILVAILYQKIDYASFIIIAASQIIVLQSSNAERNDFLTGLLGPIGMKQVRIVEAILISIPFLIVLCYHQEWILGVTVLIVSPVLGVLSGVRFSKTAIPTPFYKYPFEFASGFRIYVPLLILLGAIMTIALSIGNFNLALFCLFASLLSLLPYYGYLEQTYFVWTSTQSAEKFLSSKIKEALGYGFLISLFYLIPILIFHFDNVLLILSVELVGLLLLVTMLLAKYSSYPKTIGLPHTILFALSMWLPPMLLILIPLFWNKSIKRIKLILQ